MSVHVYDLAHGRTGDKGNTSNISVICYEEKDWQFLREVLTAGAGNAGIQPHRRRPGAAL